VKKELSRSTMTHPKNGKYIALSERRFFKSEKENFYPFAPFSPSFLLFFNVPLNYFCTRTVYKSCHKIRKRGRPKLISQRGGTLKFLVTIKIFRAFVSFCVHMHEVTSTLVVGAAYYADKLLGVRERSARCKS
jgi:hypothetical protein